MKTTTTKPRKKRQTKKPAKPATESYGWRLTPEELRAVVRLPNKTAPRRNPHPFADIGAL